MTYGTDLAELPILENQLLFSSQALRTCDISMRYSYLVCLSVIMTIFTLSHLSSVIQLLKLLIFILPSVKKGIRAQI